MFFPFGKQCSYSENDWYLPSHIFQWYFICQFLVTFRTKTDTTWSATQLGPRPVKPGLGGHDDGVWGVDDGVENSSLQLRKRGRTAWLVCATFSDFTQVGNHFGNEKRNNNGETACQEVSRHNQFLLVIHTDVYRQTKQ